MAAGCWEEGGLYVLILLPGLVLDVSRRPGRTVAVDSEDLCEAPSWECF